jgi:hypothetical protein
MLSDMTNKIRKRVQDRSIVHTNLSPGTGTTKMKKIKTVLALMNELQIQDSTGSDDELDTSKTTSVCKLAQVPPAFWMTIPFVTKKWLLNERKRQQQEDGSKKKSLNSSAMIIGFPSIMHMPVSV